MIPMTSGNRQITEAVGLMITVENRLTILVLADLEKWCVVSRLDEIALVVDLEQPRGFIAHLTAQNTRYRKACFTCVEWRAIDCANLTHSIADKTRGPIHRANIHQCRTVSRCFGGKLLVDNANHGL